MGDASHSMDGVFTVTGAGADIWGSNDAFSYVHKNAGNWRQNTPNHLAHLHAQTALLAVAASLVWGYWGTDRNLLECPA